MKRWKKSLEKNTTGAIKSIRHTLKTSNVQHHVCGCVDFCVLFILEAKVKIILPAYNKNMYFDNKRHTVSLMCYFSVCSCLLAVCLCGCGCLLCSTEHNEAFGRSNAHPIHMCMGHNHGFDPQQPTQPKYVLWSVYHRKIFSFCNINGIVKLTFYLRCNSCSFCCRRLFSILPCTLAHALIYQ